MQNNTSVKGNCRARSTELEISVHLDMMKKLPHKLFASWGRRLPCGDSSLIDDFAEAETRMVRLWELVLHKISTPVTRRTTCVLSDLSRWGYPNSSI
jgi:hypothetical protein